MASAACCLLNEPWIPVRWSPHAQHPGTQKLAERVGLRELLLRSHDIAQLAIGHPPAHSALLRVLYALTARVTGLDRAGDRDWGERRFDILDQQALQEKQIDAYFARWESRFFLHDPDGGRPWMQDARLVEQCDPDNTAGVNKLIMTRPSGNNHSWFHHSSAARPDLPSAPEAALNLLAWHYYGASGTCSTRTVGGIAGGNTAAGPLRTAMSYHPEGDTLFETLLAGLVAPPRTVDPEHDLCPWEWDEYPDVETHLLPTGPCSRLTACSQHAVLLVPDDEQPGRVKDAYITWAYRTGRIPRDDDYLIWQISQQGNRYPRPASAERGLWRDLDALLLKEPVATTQPQRPKVFEYAAELSEGLPVDLRVRALGFDQEPQAKDRQFVNGLTPPVLGFVETQAIRTAQPVARLRQLGEMYGQRLDRAVKKAWKAYTDAADADAETWSVDAAARYWPAAEAEFWSRFALLDRTGTKPDGGFDHQSARTAFLHLAQDAYRSVTASVTRTQRGAKAVAHAQLELHGGPRKPKKTPKKQKDDDR